MNEIIYTVSQLNREVRTLLEDTFPLIWLEGEISNLAKPSSGHWYFSLKDSQAQVRCAMFAQRNRLLSKAPQDGNKVLVRARISLYEGRGEYQLIVEHLEETGDGALRRAFELLKNKLAAEGLFDPTCKHELPYLPKQIGVITSSTGAAIRDIISTLRRRFAAIPIIIYPTAVQGTEAAAQIVTAIELANQRQECDVLILARGGGSLEDLWPFNEEKVARAIFASQIPIVSGVGHEVDFTIADFVADQRAATPTAAAEIVSPDHLSWSLDLNKLGQRLTRILQQQIVVQQQLLISLGKRLRHPGQLLTEKAQRLDEVEQYLCRAMLLQLQHWQQRVLHARQVISVINPLATLQRGYAIAMHTDTQQVITSIQAVSVQDSLLLRLQDGKLVCQVLDKI